MKNILIYNSGGGLGDSIQLFDLATSLKINFKNSTVFYLGAHENHFQGKLKEYGIDIPTLDLNLKYFEAEDESGDYYEMDFNLEEISKVIQ